MIQIYDVNNTSYDKNGDIVLTPISAIIHPILNGAWEAELTHPIDKEGRWKHIVEEAVVKMPGFYEHWEDQLFRIKSVEKQDSGVTATMEPIFYDAMGDCFLTDVRAVQENGQQALTTMLSPNAKYSASSNITKVNTAYYNYVNFLEALNGNIDQSFIKRWGGEILYNNYQVVVNTQVGGDYGVELRYGKNIPQDGMQFTADVRDIVTRLYPKAYNGRKLSGNGYVDSPLINNYPVVMAATLTFENIKLRQDMEDTEAAEDNVIICEDQEELDQVLTEQCQAQFEAGIDKPKITISVDMVLLQNTEQYKDVKQLETVSLGDIVHCRNTHLGITNDARVIELEYDCIRRKVTSVVLGDYEYSYFDDVSSTTQIVQGIINPDGSVMAERVQGILNGIYTQLRLQSTAAQKVDGVAFKVEDLDTTSPLYGCMIWGTQGIQISTKRTADGRDWDWTTAITANGIVANAIVTGLLSDKTGNNYWDLDTGEFRLSSTGFEVDGETLEQYINNSLTQQQIFNKLTNNGQLQGIYMQDGLLYINGTYIKAGIITDNVGKNYWNLNTGEFRLSATSTVGGEPIATQNNTISSVDVEYAVGDSDTVAPTTGWSTNSPQWQAGKYIWQRTVTTMQDGTQNISEPTCIQGAAGASGESTTIISNTVDYAISDSGTVPPNDWLENIPPLQPGKYLWTRTVTEYSDGESSIAYGVSYQGENGTNGTDGINGTDGTDGIGIVSSNVDYQVSDSGVTPPTGDWSDTVPDMEPGQFLWTRTQFTYTDGDVTTSYSVSYQGENGSQGVPGPPGEDGQTLYTWIKYADTPTSGMSDTPDGKKYLGIAYNKESPIESGNYEDYQWSDIKGEDGIPGTPGENGETLYTWIKYATDVSGSGMSDSPEGCSYIGIAYNKKSPEESDSPTDYAWSLIQGEAGIGVKNVVEEYYLSTSSTTQTGGSWSTAQPEWQKGKYIWTRSKITWTDNSVTYTDPVLAKAINGANEAVDDLNTSLDQQEVFNRLTNNGQAQGIYMQDGLLYINGTYIKAGIITDNVGKNYWNLNSGEFRLSSTSTVGGEPIATQNNTIASVDVEYAVGDSDATAPTTGWSTASPQWQAGKYIWQRTVTTMQDGTQNTSEPTCIQGAAGQSGESVTIESNTTTYAVSDSGTETPEQWQSTIPVAQPGQYLWSKTETKYSDGSTSTSYGVTYQGINGTDGTDGNGIASSSVQYQIGDSSDTPPTGRWADSIPDMQPGDYLWTRTQFTYSDGSVTTTYSVSYLGENGSQGIQGPPGENGQTLYTWIKYADTPTSGMSDLPDGKAYLGIAYNKESPVESTNYGDYQWSDIKGEDGLPGAPGENGETLYTWIKYATDANGSNMSDSPAGCSYIGIAYNKSTPEESSNPTDYAWSLIQGEAGIGVESVVDEYYLSNSEAEPSGGFWTTTQPEWKLGFYIWTRSAVTYTSGETEYTDPILAQAINSANQAVSDLDNSLNQEGVFNRLTNNGQTQGIYLQDGILYINASYIASGTVKGNLIDARNLVIKDSAGNTTFAVDANGNVSIRCTSFSLNGSTISSIANSAANNAYQNAKDYTDNELSNFTPILTQEEVFNALTNDGQMQGIYMQNGYLYINASYINTGNLAGWTVDRNNLKIYCQANTIYGKTTITLDARNGKISISNNTTGITTTLDHYGVESTSGHFDNLWANVLLVGNSSSGNSALNVGSGSFTLTVPAYMGNISTSGTVALNGTTRIEGTLNIPGALNTNGKVSFGSDGQGEGMFNVHDIAYFYKDIYYANAPQTSGGNYVRIGSSGRIFRQGSSSRRYKNHIRYMDAEEAENLYNIPVVFFKYKDGYLAKDDPKVNEALPGFYAEDIAGYVPAAADYKDIDGQRLPENWDSRYLIPYMVKCIQEQHKEIEQLKETNNKILQALASAGIEV